MLDRASTFAHPEIVKLLKTRIVPVAIDQANQRRQKDTEGEFFRKIAGQSPRNDFSQTTQGFYLATPAGKLMLYNNNRDPEKVLRLLREQLNEFDEDPLLQKADVVRRESVDKRYSQEPPRGGLIIRVRSKVLDGYEPTTNKWRRIFQTALSRDNLWITAREAELLRQGNVAESFAQRLALFHLVDNTRGEPLMWRPDEVRMIELKIDGERLTGRAEIVSRDGSRGFEGELYGKLKIESGVVQQFDLVALGDCWGEGPFTRGAPEGRFPLAIAFELADGTDIADSLSPQGARGWLEGYLKQ
ncbi:MAG TPA: hypothetical protein DDW52_03355 [Planctomycetaceae bacterium]|nr:hypothetical protein [Planctomycetaceae bacterium]